MDGVDLDFAAELAHSRELRDDGLWECEPCGEFFESCVVVAAIGVDAMLCDLAFFPRR